MNDTRQYTFMTLVASLV